MTTVQTQPKKKNAPPVYNFKSGLDLASLDKRLEFLEKNKHDYITPVRELTMTEDNRLKFVNGKTHELELNNWSHGQLASFSGIPKAFYEEIKTENKSLLAEVVNHRLNLYGDQKRMIRTVHDTNGQMKVRAFLGDSYRPLDCHALMWAALEPMQKAGLEIVSSELTDQRMYIKALSPRLKTEVAKGDVVQYGITLSSSDVGAGALRVEPMVMRLVCLNGAISSTALRKFHKGSKHEIGDNFAELLSQATIEKRNAAFWSEVRDLITQSLAPKFFEKEVEKMKAAIENRITNTDLEEVIEVTAKTVGMSLSDDKKRSILFALANGNEGAGLTQWGLANSFTRTAQLDSVDYDTAIQFERAGGEIISLTEKDWTRINA